AQRRRGGGDLVAATDANAGVNVYAITGARIVTVSGPTIERGTVVIRDGLIAAVGADVAAPPDARPVDGTGLTVYPGLIDASSALGIPRPTPTPGAAPGGGFAGLFGQSAPSATSPNSTQLPGLQPELLAARRYREANEIYERNPRGLRRPEQDKSLAALLPALDRRMPIVMQADREREIERALDLAQEFNLQMIINGGQEADRVAARLKALNV